jgi:chromosome segregation ATPase
VVQYGAATGEDIFAKVKGLIADLIAKLEKEAQQDATEKAYCDEQLSETSAKESDMEDVLKKLKAQLDRKSAKFAEVKDDLTEMQAELAEMTKDQSKLTKIREEEHAAFSVEKTDLEQGIQGVRKAMDILRDYYSQQDDSDVSGPPAALLQSMQPSPPDVSHKKQTGVDSIISTLEMVESNFAAGLAKTQTQESDSQNEYDEATKEFEVSRETLETQVKYKTKEYKSLDKTISQLSSDLDSSQTENAALLEFSAKLKDRCIAQPETYAEIKRRRDAEITGLKEALEILKSEAALMQRAKRSQKLRGQSL